MPGIKGKTNNPNGRPADPSIKILREAGREELLKRIPEVFEKLDSIKRTENYLDYFMRLFKHFMPPLEAEFQSAEQGQMNALQIFEIIAEKMFISNAQQQTLPEPQKKIPVKLKKS